MFIAVILFILILGFLVFIHEFAHYLAAKRSGVLVEEFGFGYPPRIWGKKIGETIYSINWIPFGGFVKIHGESGEEKFRKDRRGFYAQKPSTKAKIISAGVIANVLAGIILFYVVLAGQNFQLFIPSVFNHKLVAGVQTDYPFISEVLKNTPAETAGLKSHDLVVSANSISFSSANDFVDFVNENKGMEINLELRNLLDNQSRQVKVIPREEPPEKEGPLGIKIGQMIHISYSSPSEKIFSGVLHSVNILDYSLRIFGKLIKESFVQRDIRPVAQSFVGPVGILVLVKLTIAGGVWEILNLIAIISLGLALINAMPIPGADGAKMLFVIYEVAFKKPVPERFERNFNAAGFIFIILLLLLITIKDFIQFKDILF